MSKLRIAVVGAGILGSRHARVFQEQAESEVVAIIDPDQERAHRVAERVEAEAFADLDQLWRAKEVDALAVATPDHLHREPVLAALARNKHVFVEKPLATSRDDMDAIAAAAERSSAIAMVNYSQRFVAEYAWIKRILADGLLGQPVMAISHKFDRIYVPTRMIAWAAETSPIYFMSSHDLDLLHWYLQADPVAVVAQDAKGVLAAQGIDVHDGLNAMIRFEGGAIGNIHSSWIYPDSYPHMADGHLQIIGSLGTLSLHNGRRRIEIHHAKGSVEQVFSGPHTADEVDGRIAGAFVDSVRCFLACIRDGREPETAPRHVLPMCHAQAAMITSLRTGSPVAVQ